ncbi:MAG: hypothetical protein GX133_05385 [Syntrophomonadaceae bacterium]|nr:hypothetical protein [Syntrophomonadaceae bacterium]
MLGDERKGPASVKPGGKPLISPQEVHDFGIEVVVEHMEQDGYQDFKVCNLLNTDPQIRAVKDGQTINVIVRTAMFPGHAQLVQRDSVQHALDNARSKGELCCFAGVELYRACTPNEMKTPRPLREVGGTGFYIYYGGLQELIIWQ